MPRDPPKPAPRSFKRPTSAPVFGSPPKPAGPKKLLVRNLPKNITNDRLELCFESRSKFGRQLSLEENEVKLDKKKREAIICYKRDEDADLVLETCQDHDITLDGEALDIQLYNDDCRDFQRSSERFSVVAGSNEDDVDSIREEEEDDDEADNRTVEVSGFSESTSRDNLYYYFSNSKKGGGDIEGDITIDKDERKAQIVFKDKNVVENLLGRKHVLSEQTLCVRKFAYSKTDLLLKGVTDNISDETLKLFIEAKLIKSEFNIPVFNEDRTRALIQAKEPIDFKSVFEICERKPVEGNYLTPCRVPLTDCIIVTDIPSVTSDTFKYYFESKKSGGGEKDVEKVELHEDENYCLVFFAKTEVVQPVCQQAKHILSGTTLSVCPYYTSLGVPASSGSKTKFVVPEPIDLSDQDTNKIKFVFSNKVQKTAVNRELEKHHAKLSLEDNTHTLECILTTTVKGCRKLATTWKETALKALTDYLKKIDVRVKPIDDTARKEILEALNDVDIPDPDQVAVFFPKGSSNVVLVGIKSEVQHVWKIIDKTVTEVEAKVKDARSMVEETKNLKQQWKVDYLRWKFVNRMKGQFPDLDIKISETKPQVIFKGRKEEVTSAEIEMFQELQQIQESRHKMVKEKLKLLGKDEVKDEINKRLQSEHVDCIWKIKDDQLLVYVEDSRQVSDVLDVIHDFVTKVAIRLDSTKTDILKSRAWKDAEQKLEKKCRGCIEINWNKKDNMLEVYTTEVYERMVSDELDTFFEEHAVYEESFRCDPSERKFLILNKKEELKGRPDAKAIIFKKDDILLKGTRAELDSAKSILSNMKKKIVSREETLSKPGLQKYFACEEGKARIQQTEKTVPCIIVMQGGGGGKSSGNIHNQGNYQGARQGSSTFAKPTKCAEGKARSGLMVEVFGGDMTELKVDVLVNASNNKLEHAGGLAAVIVRKGGKSIQDECLDHVKSKGQLSAGDVFVSKAGNLPCQAIAHALGPVWKGGSHNEEDVLQKAIKKCLEETEKRGYNSIAIPALSTGAFNYPADKACAAIVEQVVNQGGLKSVKKVVLCDINEATVKCFVMALQAEVKDVKIHYTFDSFHHGPTWLHTDGSANRHERGRRRSSPSPDRDSGHTKVEVVQAELAKQRVDVIVNSTSKDLKLDKGIASKALLRAAGNEIQKECYNNYGGGIKVGDVAVTKGYGLKCKKVYHIAVDTYERGQGHLKALWSVVEHCLNEANQNGATSIAFPPIGCGAQKYPVKDVADTMFKCISKFLEKTRNTSLKTIRIVIYTEDHDKFEVFQRESRHCSAASNSSSSASPPRTRRSIKKQKNAQVIKVSKDLAQFRIDCLDVNVRQGDITSEDTDAIVASCNLDLDLSKGAVTRALLQKGGDEIKKDCEKQRATMRKEGIAVTNAGKLNSNYIIHVETKYKTKEWLRPVEQCLKTAEDHGFKSVAFPTLGISVGCSAEGIAELMQEAMTNFTKNNVVKSLQEVRIIVFQKEIVTKFINAMKDSIEGTGDSPDHDQERETLHARKPHPPDNKGGSHSTDNVPIKIYAEGECNVAKAFKQLREEVDYEWIVSDLTESVLFRMPQQKLDQIKQKGKGKNIQVEIDHDLGKIRLYGRVKDMMHVKDDIYGMIRAFDKSTHEHEQAKLLANIVKWIYLKEDKQYPFLDTMNKKIEEAFNKKESKVRITDCIGREYEIDFSNMTEHDVKNPAQKFTVIRRDVIAESSKELPKTWKPMKDDQNLLLVPLQPSDQEYKDVVKEFTSTLGRKPNIIKIERIQNQVLYTQYVAKRKQMNQQNPNNKKNERMLWHGTAMEAVSSINNNGFNRSYCGKNGDSSDHDQERVTPQQRKPHPPDNKGGSHNTDNVPIKIYAEGDHNVTKAFKQLRKGVEDEWIVHDLMESVLFRMPQQKIDQIKQKGKGKNIQVEIDHDLGKIRLHGLVKDMMHVKDDIHGMIRAFDKSTHEHEQAKLLANIVKWIYLKGDKQYPFPDTMNKRIEEAFNKKESKVRVKDHSGGEYEIDFANMTEHDVKNPKQKFTVIRRDVLAESSKELPKTWKPMQDDQNLLLVPLQPSEQEYKDVVQEFTSTLGRTPNIIKIERIQNQALYTQYVAKRKQMNQQNSNNKKNERMLWHGTAVDAVNSINHHGFNRSYCGKNGYEPTLGRGHRDNHFSQRHEQTQGDTVKLTVYAESAENVDRAIKQLKKSMFDEWIVDNISEPLILTMPNHKLDAIKKEARNHSVQVDFDRDLGGIKLQGLVRNIMSVKDKINSVLRAHEHSKHEYQQAKLLANIVRWSYLKDNKQFPFPSTWNKKVEEAFRNKEAKVKVKDRSGGEYEIDFGTMTEYDVKNTKEKFPVLRRDIVAESSNFLSQELPKHWAKMKPDENLMLVDLKQTDSEYQSVLGDFMKTLGRTPQIIKIERLQNQALYTQYAAKRKQMNQQNSHRKDNERMLWHGTAAGPVTSINNHGFNRSFCSRCAYGDGVYFAVNASYSDGGYSAPDANGHKRMYRCLVLTGDYTNGVGGMRMPPQKPGQPSHVLYDSLSGPGMFIIFNDCQAYPEHLITYT